MEPDVDSWVKVTGGQHCSCNLLLLLSAKINHPFYQHSTNEEEISKKKIQMTLHCVKEL